MTRKREEKWRKKDIYIYTRGPSALYGFRLDGVKWPCMELRRRQDNVQHSLAGVVLVYSPFFQLASSCRVEIWINRMALLIRRLKPFTTVMVLRGCIAERLFLMENHWKCFWEWWCFVVDVMLLRWESEKKKKKRVMRIFCGMELSLLSWEDRLFYLEGIKCVGKVGEVERFIWKELNVKRLFDNS